MIFELFKIPKSVIIVHGWHYFTHLCILLAGKLRGHTVCVRCDMPQNQELLKKGWKQFVKRLGLKYILFPRVNYFLYIGSQNRLLYKSYGLPDTRLLSCPYAVDNDRFMAQWQHLIRDKACIKQKLGIPAEDKIIVYCGKYIPKKRPLDILRAFLLLNNPNCWLIMVGEGGLRAKMEDVIQEHNIKNVMLTGFVNQSRIAEYYAASDVFVMCSEAGETWGLSVNEAMNFNLPVIVSDLTGCSEDLVQDGINGYIFKTGNIFDLAKKLKLVLIENKLLWSVSSQTILKDYSFSVINNNIKAVLN